MFFLAANQASGYKTPKCGRAKLLICFQKPKYLWSQQMWSAEKIPFIESINWVEIVQMSKKTLDPHVGGYVLVPKSKLAGSELSWGLLILNFPSSTKLSICIFYQILSLLTGLAILSDKTDYSPVASLDRRVGGRASHSKFGEPGGQCNKGHWDMAHAASNNLQSHFKQVSSMHLASTNHPLTTQQLHIKHA